MDFESIDGLSEAEIQMLYESDVIYSDDSERIGWWVSVSTWHCREGSCTQYDWGYESYSYKGYYCRGNCDGYSGLYTCWYAPR